MGQLKFYPQENYAEFKSFSERNAYKNSFYFDKSRTLFLCEYQRKNGAVKAVAVRWESNAVLSASVLLNRKI
jgi:hypothetical protein